MVKKFWVSLSSVIIISLAVPAFATVFKTSDMSGNWYIYSIEVDMEMPAVYWVRGNITVNNAGNITAGTYFAPDGSAVNLSSGQFLLNPQGIISGEFTTPGNTGTVVHGKLDQSKMVGTAVLIGSDNTMDILTFIKGGGTFTTSDLEGTWYVYQTIIDPSTGAVFWIYGTYTSDASGRVTNGSFTRPDGSTLTVDSGSLSVNSSGIVTGDIALSSGQKLTIVHSKIDHGKTIAVGVSLEPNGGMAMAYLVKAGGAFEPTDIAGKSFAYGLIIDPSIPAVYWVYGNLKTDASGNFTRVYKTPTGDSVTGTGLATMDTLGVINATVSFDTGDTGVTYLKQDQGDTIRMGVSVTTGGMMGIWQFYEASFTTMPALPLLLLND